MNKLQPYFLSVAVLTLSGPAIAKPPTPAPSATSVSLTRIDCGRVFVGTLDAFSDTRAYEGRSGWLTNSCYLIQHGDDYLLWDTGFPAALHGAPVDTNTTGFSPTLDTPLTESLDALQVDLADIDYVGLSHFHIDHVGQLPVFTQSVLLLGQADWDTLVQEQPAPELDPSFFTAWLQGQASVQPVAGDHDVFGDGSVVMLATPGHTEGHHALLVQLAETGPVLLTGDAVHFEENYKHNRVPSFNADRAATLASIDRLQRLAHNLGATLIIQHEADHVKRLPPFPNAAH